MATAFRRAYRLTRLITHISAGLSIITLLFPRYDASQREQRIRRWSIQLNRLLGIEVRVYGQPPTFGEQALLLSNHVSWFDVFAINSASTARFVAKSEVRNWPLIGRLCAGTDTIFIEREKKRDAIRANNEIREALQTGHKVAIFPEGTTSDGLSLKPFRSSLLQPAIDSQSPIQPIYLRYVDAKGHPSTAAAYIEDISFGASLWKLLGTQNLAIELHYLPALPATEYFDRQELSRRLEACINTRHNELMHRATDIPAAPELGTTGRPQA